MKNEFGALVELYW